MALAWFLLAWSGYTLYALTAAKRRRSLTSSLFAYRETWMRNVLRRDSRISDVALIGSLATMVNFLASTTILILAGIAAAICSTDDFVGLLSNHAYIAETTKGVVQFKLLLLAIIFVFAFFKLTWSMRQHTFCSIMLGAMPSGGTGDLTPEEKNIAFCAARISDRAGHEFNYGLRSYYFALAALTWFIGPWVFMGMTSAVIVVLYKREFRSLPLKYLVLGLKDADLGKTLPLSD